MKKMPLYTHPLYTDGIHPEARFPRDRYRLITEALASDPAARELVEIKTSPLAPQEAFTSAHDAEYVHRFLSGEMDRQERRRIGLRPWTPLLIERTQRLMGGALAALHDALDFGGLSANLAGGTHHAFADRGAGYCVFNDLVVCVGAARERGVGKIAIVDLDVHQGDGTAAMLSGDPLSFTLSVHGQTNFPFEKEQSDLDIGLEKGVGDEDYLEAVDRGLEAVVDFQPEALFFQAGVDPLETDKLGHLKVTRQGLRARNDKVFALAESLGVPCVVFMGGGYSRPIERTVDAFADLFIQGGRWHRRRMGKAYP